MEKRECRRCGSSKPKTGFRESSPGYLRRVCNECMDAAAVAWQEKNKQRSKEWQKQYYERNRDKQIASAKEWNEANKARYTANVASAYRRRRSEVIAAYGGKCACCGETEPTFLVIDHVNDDGYKYRWKKGSSSYGPHSGAQLLAFIRDAGFPSDYQVLCANCNTSKSINGGFCSHIGALPS